jgi:alpha-beta hydrolase superfamily lysophospholipase
MRLIGRLVGGVLLVLLVLAAAIWALVPAAGVDREIAFDAADLPADLDAYLRAKEQSFPDLVAGVEARILWAGAAGARTRLSIVYVHGFSASSEEVRPLPDDVAAALGANLFLARLAGHGRSGAAMAEPEAGDWVEDVAEALAIGRRIGERVILIGTSTGGTLALIAATDPKLSEDLAGVVFVSPNFGLSSPLARLLELPGAVSWVPLLIGAEHSFETRNEAHRRYWTERYPTTALASLAALIGHVRAIDPAGAVVPALFLYSDTDRVIDTTLITPVAEAWGAAARAQRVTLRADDDPDGHVIAGDVLSPGQTASVARTIVEWVRSLGQSAGHEAK